jgi:TolB protein
MTDVSGIASVAWTLDTLAGPQSAGASIPPDTLPSVAFSAVASPGPASRLAFRVQPTSVFADRPFPRVVEVAALDQYGNTATDFTGTVTVTLGPSGSLAGTTSVAAVSGVAIFADLRIAQAGTGYSLTASATGLPPVTTAAFQVVTPGSGQITFVSGRDGNSEIYVMNADGSGQVNLTNNPGNDISPVWSPDGTRIAFTSDRDGNQEIYVMNADGSGQVNFTNSPADDWLPAWSPDGSRITFVSYRDGNSEIYVMNADGSGQVNLTNNPGIDYEPVWSPDGSKIAFNSTRDGGYEIYIMNADGSGVTRLHGEDVAGWLPDGWSPDGSKIVYSVFKGGCSLRPGGCSTAKSYILVMNADGSGVTSLTNTGNDGSPVWAPDGTRIAFESNRDGNSEIYVMNADGSGQVNLTNNPGSDREPAWRPR